LSDYFSPLNQYHELTYIVFSYISLSPALRQTDLRDDSLGLLFLLME